MEGRGAKTFLIILVSLLFILFLIILLVNNIWGNEQTIFNNIGNGSQNSVVGGNNPESSGGLDEINQRLKDVSINESLYLKGKDGKDYAAFSVSDFIHKDENTKNKKAATEFFKGAKKAENVNIIRTEKGYAFEYFDLPAGAGPGKYYKLETDNTGKIIDRYRYGLNKEGKVIEDTYTYLLGERVSYSYKG